MSWKHRFTGTWVREDTLDETTPIRVTVESGGVTLGDMTEAFKAYLKAIGFDWTPENTPFSDEEE